ncbi:Uncharacterised protein [Mycobacteroides abscessus subsp. abscessus]|nr:Uncharacterised protein [Mycobacteroides abscessus subsp. abscessus]
MSDAFAAFPSFCSSLTSDLKIRNDLPSERARSGSFLAPKSSANTTITITQCMGCRPPNVVTSRRRVCLECYPRPRGGQLA